MLWFIVHSFHFQLWFEFSLRLVKRDNYMYTWDTYKESRWWFSKIKWDILTFFSNAMHAFHFTRNCRQLCWKFHLTGSDFHFTLLLDSGYSLWMFLRLNYTMTFWCHILDKFVFICAHCLYLKLKTLVIIRVVM